MDNANVINFLTRCDKPLTLADITVTWQEGGGEYTTTRTITGRQIAQLITAASEDTQADSQIGNFESGRIAYRLRGLSALVFPSGGDSCHEDDSRVLIADLLHQWAGELEADAAESDEAWPQQFTVKLAAPREGEHARSGEQS